MSKVQRTTKFNTDDFIVKEVDVFEGHDSKIIKKIDMLTNDCKITILDKREGHDEKYERKVNTSELDEYLGAITYIQTWFKRFTGGSDFGF